MANKKSRSIQEQIDLLKDRGMIIEDEEFARLHLNHVSYSPIKGVLVGYAKGQRPAYIYGGVQI